MIALVYRARLLLGVLLTALMTTACTSSQQGSAHSNCQSLVAYTIGLSSGSMAIGVRSVCGTLVAEFRPPNDMDYSNPVVDPRGGEVAFDGQGLRDEILVGSLATGRVRSVASVSGRVSNPSFSPTGKQLAFLLQPYSNGTSQNPCLYVVNASKRSTLMRNCGFYGFNLLSSALPQVSPATSLMWSPDGKYFMISINGTGGNEISVVRANDPQRSTLYLTPKGTLLDSFFGPDGNSVFLVYALDGALAQLWRYDEKSARFEQVTDVTDGLISASLTNDWMLYYRSGSGMKIYSLNLRTGRNDTLTSTAPAAYPAVAVQVEGRANSRKLYGRIIRVDHSRTPLLGLVWGGNQRGYGLPEPIFIFNGGDPSGVVSGVRWRSWGGTEAIGTGMALHVTTSVALAHPKSAHVVAFGLGICHGRFVYSHIEWYFPQYGQAFDPKTYINDCTGSYVDHGKAY